jgi:FkbM family methyltransferase
MKDYSQWGEQKIIHNFFKDTKRGRFLDLGAFDGITGSNTYGLWMKGWSGVCVEASELNFRKLRATYKATRRIQCVNAAVMPTPGLVLFHDANGQCGSAMPKEQISPAVQKYVVDSYHVGGITPDQLHRQFCVNGDGEFDFVSFDLEGVDYEVICKSDKLLKKVKLVCFEDALPGTPFNAEYKQSILDKLASFGFTKVIGTTTTAKDSCNTIVARQ